MTIRSEIAWKNAVWWYPYHPIWANYPIRQYIESCDHQIWNRMKKCCLMIPISSHSSNLPNQAIYRVMWPSDLKRDACRSHKNSLISIYISTVYTNFFGNLHDFMKARDWQCRARRRKRRVRTLAAMTPMRNSDAATDPDRNRSKRSLIQKPVADFGHNKWIGSDPNCWCLLISHFGAMMSLIRGATGGASYICPSAGTPHCPCNLPWIMK